MGVRSAEREEGREREWRREGDEREREGDEREIEYPLMTSKGRASPNYRRM